MLKPQRRLIDTPYGAVHYWWVGEGAPLLLIHQSTQSSDEYQEFAQYLGLHRQVIAVDLPGHGCSGDPDKELTIPEFAQSTLSVLDDLDQAQVDVLGHHGGGMVAIALAANHPKRVRKVVTSGAGLPPPELKDKILNQPMSRDLPMDPEGAFLMRTWSIYRDMSGPNQPPERWFKPFSTGLRARLRPYDMHRETMLFDYAAALQVVEHDALMMRGEHDSYSGDVQAASEVLVRGQMDTVPDCGAWQYYENPKATAERVQAFLED